MLTDIFAYRYAGTPIWKEYGEKERIVLVQAFRIVSEQIYPYYFKDGKENPENKAIWTTIHDRMSMELGLKELAPSIVGYYTTVAGTQRWNSFIQTPVRRCEVFMEAKFDGSIQADRFIKERMSLIEIAFRIRQEEIAEINAKLPSEILMAKIVSTSREGVRIPGDRTEVLKRINANLNAAFMQSVSELNERFRRAGCSLNYHNGFIQISDDVLTQKITEQPFWLAVAGPDWRNVDVDMKEAIDLRDNGGRDPAFYAAKALESTIKIISDKKGWTTGKEAGAANYLDRLASNGFIAPWERDIIKKFFSEVRNSLGHGPGSAEMPNLDRRQTEWAIEFCMASIKGLVMRL